MNILERKAINILLKLPPAAMNKKVVGFFQREGEKDREAAGLSSLQSFLTQIKPH